MKHIVFFTGAGMSQESGISTFRDSNGLWENHDVMEVASPEGFQNNPKLVLEFYNQRRKQLFDVKPNPGHTLIALLEKKFQVTVITQNVDDLHERAGSTNVLHLHGELRKVRSVDDESTVLNWNEDLVLGDVDKNGSQLRPHIVWFGENVPMMDEAIEVAEKADVFVVVGSSLQVYPAAGLIHYTSGLKYYIDPNPTEELSDVITIESKASSGIEQLISMFIEE